MFLKKNSKNQILLVLATAAGTKKDSDHEMIHLSLSFDPADEVPDAGPG